MKQRGPNYDSTLSSVATEIAALEAADRGILEQTIDKVLDQVPTMLEAVREPHFKSLLHIKEENDFVMGLAWGKIYTEFVAYLIASRGSSYDNEEGNKIAQIVMRRSSELRNAIFNGG